MKKTDVTLIVAIGILICQAPAIWGQDITEFNTTRMISLKAESQEIKININVPESYKYMSLWIAANLNEGDLSVELLDPNGEKKGDFSVGCALSISRPAGTDQENTSHEVVQGRINKSINNPLKGTWVIRLNPKKATGQVQIEIDQHLPGTKKNDN